MMLDKKDIPSPGIYPESLAVSERYKDAAKRIQSATTVQDLFVALNYMLPAYKHVRLKPTRFHPTTKRPVFGRWIPVEESRVESAEYILDTNGILGIKIHTILKSELNRICKKVIASGKQFRYLALSGTIVVSKLTSKSVEFTFEDNL